MGRVQWINFAKISVQISYCFPAVNTTNFTQPSHFTPVGPVNYSIFNMVFQQMQEGFGGGGLWFDVSPTLDNT